ncbi:HEAT repeat domain-containing protein [Petrachloros mirabilis]
MWRWVCGLALLASGSALPSLDKAEARRDIVTAEEKERLKGVKTIYLETLAITDKGTVDSAGVATVAASKLKAFGYAVVSAGAREYDVVVKIKCEEHKVWEGTVTSGGDADQLDPAARLWKGPACQITYRTDGLVTNWRHEVRGRLSTAADAKTAMPAAPNGAAILADLCARLEEDPFPLLLAGAWGQSPRLIRLLDDPTATQTQKTTAITLLGNMFAVDAIPSLSRMLQEKDSTVAQNAAVALGAIGHPDCIPLLLSALEHQKAETRLAAVQGLGRLAPLHPNSPIVPTLLERLPKETLPIQTEIVLALGKTTDRRILDPLRALNRVVREKIRSDSSRELRELQHALAISLDQFDGPHTEE